MLSGRFDLLGYQHLSFGDPIDWHLDPVHGRRAPRLHWSAIDPLDPALVGDSKVVWELSRHQWTMQLAQAFALTGEERYAAAAIAAMNDWIDANPIGIGINWSSSLEVALRLMAWTWTLALLRHSAALTGGTLIRVLASIHAHAAHVEKYLSRYFSPNTHLTGEALGLFYAGVAFPEFRDAERWRATGATTLIEQADQQISVDGIYFEQSTCYQRYTCDIYLHFLLLAGRHQHRRARAHARASAADGGCARGAAAVPTASVPAIGDADGGSADAVGGTRAPGLSRHVCRRGRAVWPRATSRRPRAGRRQKSCGCWALTARTPFAQTAAGRPAAEGSRIFVAGGYAVMRSGSGRDAHQMIVDVGPLGSFGHGHADLLSVQCSDLRRGVPRRRRHLRLYRRNRNGAITSAARRRTTRCASTAADQAEPAGPFGWRERPRTTVRAWQSTTRVRRGRCRAHRFRCARHTGGASAARGVRETALLDRGRRSAR